MSTAAQPLPDAFRSLGGALYRRVLLVTGDEAQAMRAAEALFVRFVVHGRGPHDERGRWSWIYRVATAHALSLLAAETRPGGWASTSEGAPALPSMRVLRAFDGATQNIVVLSRLDRLSAGEIAEVLGLDEELVRRRLTEARASNPGSSEASTHPSRYALDRERAAHEEHLAGCGTCRADVEAAAATARAFDARVTPETVAGVSAALREERARSSSRPRWNRLFWMGGAFIVITVMAFVVARPKEIKPEQLPFKGPITASRLKAAGLQITVHRGTEVLSLAPGSPSRLGDRFHFRVRTEGPRYLELRVQGPGGDARLFPATGTTSVAVAPGQTLDQDYVVAAPQAVAGKALWIIGRFAEHPFPLDSPTVPELEIVPVRVDIEP
ncbi:MAG TPA: sigma-70 family RNA polymerase sigma factor [Polyangia bacterium]|jgi:DNA-directed RNA polymerase specialized sigma24 family protein